MKKRKKPSPTEKEKPSKKTIKLMKKIDKIVKNYPQKWGDCLKINNTVKEFLNKYSKEDFGLLQIKIILHEENPVNDPQIGETSEPSHIVVFLKNNKDIKMWWDFSTVLGLREIFDWEYQDIITLSKKDKKLYSILEKNLT
ncbi:MAG: hypothetical protein ACOCP8_02195 [archaeon]